MKRYLLVFLLPLLLIAEDSVRVNYYGKVYRRPDLESQMLTVLNNGCALRVISETDQWVEVQANGYRGWIAKSQTSLGGEAPVNISEGATSETKTARAIGFSPVILFSSLGAILLFLVVLISLSRKKRGVMRSDLTTSTKAINHQEASKLNVLIFASEDRNIKSERSNLYKKLSTCFREIGFAVHFFQTLNPGKIIMPFKVNMIAVDYKLGKNSITMLENLLEQWGISPSLHVFFYNIPNPERVKPSSSLLHASYLAHEITDQDILKMVAPLLAHIEKRHPDILSGSITGEGAYEILQLMEVGRKSGTLTISDAHDRVMGVIGFSKGKISFAKSHRNEGNQAAVELCMLREGKFTFTSLEKNQPNCNIDVTQLLLHTAQFEDEIKHSTMKSRGNHEITQTMLAS